MLPPGINLVCSSFSAALTTSTNIPTSAILVRVARVPLDRRRTAGHPRCRVASYRNTPEATATFSKFMCDGIGISTISSHAARAATVNPGPSAPNTRQQSPRKSTQPDKHFKFTTRLQVQFCDNFDFAGF